jgi:DNA-binding MurR/RpiR family transcriptional regulator
MNEARQIPTVGQVAAKFGVSKSTVTRTLKRDQRWWIEYRRNLRQQAAELRSTGLTWEQVGSALGMTAGAARAAGKRATGEWANTQDQE